MICLICPMCALFIYSKGYHVTLCPEKERPLEYESYYLDIKPKPLEPSAQLVGMFNSNILHIQSNRLDVPHNRFRYPTQPVWISNPTGMDIQPSRFGYPTQPVWISNPNVYYIPDIDYALVVVSRKKSRD